MKSSQVDKIYKALKSGAKLTTDGVHHVSGSYNAHKRIAELERKYKVEVKRIKLVVDGVERRAFAL